MLPVMDNLCDCSVRKPVLDVSLGHRGLRWNRFAERCVDCDRLHITEARGIGLDVIPNRAIQPNLVMHR